MIGRRPLLLAAMPALLRCSVGLAAAPLRVVASFSVLADMVRVVGGGRVEVVSLIGPGGDPHAYEPTPDDARRLKAAHLVVVNGLGLEGWMSRLASASGYDGTPIVASAGVPTRSMTDDGTTITDPHAWNSPANGVIYVSNIVRALTAVDPDGASAYGANGDAYVANLRALDADARRQIGAIPPAQRKVLTSHDALGYFGQAYGITFLAPLGVSTESEASARDVAALIRQIKAEHVRTYFFENSNDPRIVRQVAAATGAMPGGELYVEALSPPDGPASTYLAMLRYDIDKLVTAMRANR
jgi:zinc/manganese transport system substrate-binding protein